MGNDNILLALLRKATVELSVELWTSRFYIKGSVGLNKELSYDRVVVWYIHVEDYEKYLDPFVSEFENVAVIDMDRETRYGPVAIYELKGEQ